MAKVVPGAVVGDGEPAECCARLLPASLIAGCRCFVMKSILSSFFCLPRSARAFRLRSLSTQSLGEWDRGGRDRHDAHTDTEGTQHGATSANRLSRASAESQARHTPRRRPITSHTLAGSVDWLFASIHSSRVLRAVVGGRFGHKYWASGFGDPGVISHLSAMHAQRFGDVPSGSLYRKASSTDVFTLMRWRRKSVDKAGVSLWEGEFPSPVQDGTLPPESLQGRCQLILPPESAPPDRRSSGGDLGTALCWEGGHRRPAMIHLAGLGDYMYDVRRMMMWPLAAQHGIASLILQSPYYGERKPAWQRGAKLEHVSDLLSLGNATIEETLLLLEWCRAVGFGPLGVCGFSMGGVHSMMSAAVDKGDVALICFSAPYSAASVFCDGPLSYANDWAAMCRGRNDGVGSGGGMGAERESEQVPTQVREELRRRLGDVLAITDVRRLPAPKCPWATVLLQVWSLGFGVTG